MKTDLFLEEARLGPRHPALIEYDEAAHLPAIKRRFRQYAWVDLAHVVMLVEEGVLSRERGARLLWGLLRILELGPEGFPWDPRSGSYLVQVEHHLTSLVGQDVAGRLQTGRSRNDQEAAVERLFLRGLLLETVERLLALERVLVEGAGTHAETVMPGYTHLQHAQPWTFGHFLMRHASIFERDLQRMRECYGRANLSALGGAANAGASWPLNRRRVAELLGHAGLVVNASDAGLFARDLLEECLAVLALLMSNLGRLATDLYVWHSWEFSFVEVADGLAGTSSIMPQKKNPHALERVKALAGQAAGWLPAVMGCQRGVSSTDLDMAFGDDLVTAAGQACLGSLALMTETMTTLNVNVEVMAGRAAGFWSTASHLADELVRRYDLPFRTAHHVVGRFVRESIAAGHRPEEATAALLDQAAREVAGRPLGLGTPELRRLLDARHFVETRVTEGSTNPRHVREHVEAMGRSLDAHAHWLTGETQRVRQAIQSLEGRSQELAASA